MIREDPLSEEEVKQELERFILHWMSVDFSFGLRNVQVGGASYLAGMLAHWVYNLQTLPGFGDGFSLTQDTPATVEALNVRVED